MSVKINLRIITKNHAADPEIGLLTKSISKPFGCATAMPSAWKLMKDLGHCYSFKNFFKALDFEGIPSDYFRFPDSIPKYSAADIEKTMLERHTMQKIKRALDYRKKVIEGDFYKYHYQMDSSFLSPFDKKPLVWKIFISKTHFPSINCIQHRIIQKISLLSCNHTVL